MRIDYNVLWVDDQPQLLDGQKRMLQRLMAQEGFDLKPIFCQTLADVRGRIAEDVFRDEVDLILVDWALGGGLRGQVVISEVRGVVPYKDVVFYSAHTNVGELRRVSYEEENEGVFFVSRQGLVEEVGQLFASSIKKVLDLDHTRGIVMGATSDVDQMARESLQLAYNLLDEAGQQEIIGEMVELLREKGPAVVQRVDRLTRSPDIVSILESHHTFTANDGLRILSRLLESPAFARLSNHRVHVTSYINEVVPKRNALGHKVLTPEGKPLGIAGEAAGEVISIDDMRRLRCRLLELRGEFQTLVEGLRRPPVP